MFILGHIPPQTTNIKRCIMTLAQTHQYTYITLYNLNVVKITQLWNFFKEGDLFMFSPEDK